MRLTDERDIERAKQTMDVFISGGEKNYVQHPSYQRFVTAVERGCSLNIAKDLWILLLEGLREKYETQAETKLAFFAEEAGRNGLLSTEGEELALWCGGFDMSKIARELGHCTLEKTIIGEALDTIPITSLWGCECKMWNELSKKFVESYQGNRVHIYFRIMDETSVLERQEVPQLIRQGCEVIKWHPIYYNGSIAQGLTSRYSEVGINGQAINITEKNVGFSSQKEAGIALQEKLKQYPLKYNEMSFLHANSRFFDPNRAPFAFYE